MSPSSSGGRARPREPRLAPARATALLVAACVALQLSLALRAPLVVDEAHYALYGEHVAWSYLDHPPLVGWMQALALSVSDGRPALRAWAVACFAASCWLLFRLARRLYPDDEGWSAFLAVALWCTAPTVHLTGVALVPESALVPLALLAMHALLGVLRRRSLARWLALGACLGAAGLAKYTAVTLVVTVAGALLVERRLADLRRPGPWLAAALAALIVSPVVAWNAAHGWASFRFQVEHGTGGASWSPGRFLASRAGELLAYGPALFAGGLAAGWRALRRERGDLGARLALLLALPVLLLFWWASGRERQLPHWTQLAWLGLAIPAARWYLARGVGAPRRRALAAGLAYCGVALVALQLLVSTRALAPSRELMARSGLTGWPEAARTAVELQGELAREPGPPPVLFVDNRTRASRLAWYARPAPVQTLDRRASQFDLWFGRPEPGARGVLVTWDDGAPEGEPKSVNRFERHELLRELPIDVGGERAATFRFWRCEGYGR